jgi:hypothetical protein
MTEWKQTKQDRCGRPRLFSDLAITTALMVRRILFLPLRALQGFIDSVFRLANVPLICPHYTYRSRRAKDVEVCFKTSSRGTIQHLDIDATGLKVYGEGEWKVKKHGTDGKRRVWRKLHLAVDTDTHEIIAAELTLSGVTDEKYSSIYSNKHAEPSRRSREMVHTIQGNAIGQLGLRKRYL